MDRLRSALADTASYGSVRDNYRYNDDGNDRGDGTTTGIFAYMPFTENPALKDPMLSISGSGGGGQPAFICLGDNLQLGLGGISNQAIRDMRLVNVRPYGCRSMSTTSSTRASTTSTSWAGSTRWPTCRSNRITRF